MISPALQIALSPDGQTLATTEPPGQTPATVGQPGRLRLWDVDSGQERWRWHPVRGEEYEQPIFSADSRTVAAGVKRYDQAAGRAETFIGLWDAVALTERRRRIPADWVRLWDLAFSPDGKLLATASRDGEIVDLSTLMGQMGRSDQRGIWRDDIARLPTLPWLALPTLAPFSLPPLAMGQSGSTTWPLGTSRMPCGCQSCAPFAGWHRSRCRREPTGQSGSFYNPP